MPIFRREYEGAAAPAAGPRNPSPGSEAHGKATLIAAGTRITGQITGAAEVHIDGEVEGDVHVDGVVVVGAQGKVMGQISARTVRVGGKVAGNLLGFERVEVLPTGATEGDISAPRVVIAEGAFVKGKVEMKSRPERGAK